MTIKSQANAFTSAYEIALTYHVSSCKRYSKKPHLWLITKKVHESVRTHTQFLGSTSVSTGLEGHSRL